MSTFVDFGPYGLDEAHTEDLNKPSTRPAFSSEGLVNEIGAGVVRGDGPDPRLAPMHPESQRLSEVLNRLSLNGFEDEGHVTPEMTAKINGRTVSTPQDLIAAPHRRQATKSSSPTHVTSPTSATSTYNGQDVMMPFWVNSQILVPGTKRPLLVPVSHAEYEWQIRGPVINASIAHYFGIDGKSEFRVMDQLDQPWVMDRHAHEYRNAEAIEVTRLAGAMVAAYARLHRERPKLPFGGYYALGVCQDVVAAIELRMTGKATLFPNTADGALFDDPKDAEINALIKAIPKDRDGKPPQARADLRLPPHRRPRRRHHPRLRPGPHRRPQGLDRRHPRTHTHLAANGLKGRALGNRRIVRPLDHRASSKGERPSIRKH